MYEANKDYGTDIKIRCYFKYFSKSIAMRYCPMRGAKRINNQDIRYIERVKHNTVMIYLYGKYEILNRIYLIHSFKIRE